MCFALYKESTVFGVLSGSDTYINVSVPIVSGNTEEEVVED